MLSEGESRFGISPCASSRFTVRPAILGPPRSRLGFRSVSNLLARCDSRPTRDYRRTSFAAQRQRTAHPPRAIAKMESRARRNGASSHVSAVAGSSTRGSPQRIVRGLLSRATELEGFHREGTSTLVTQIRWLIGRSRSSCTGPLGQRIDAWTNPSRLQAEEDIFAVL